MFYSYSSTTQDARLGPLRGRLKGCPELEDLYTGIWPQTRIDGNQPEPAAIGPG